MATPCGYGVFRRRGYEFLLVRKLREIINSEELCSIKNTVAASSSPSCNVVLGKLEETPTSEVVDCVVHGELIVGENAVVKGGGSAAQCQTGSRRRSTCYIVLLSTNSSCL